MRITFMERYFKIRAGSEASKEISENGFTQDMVKMMLGASGGPKWLILYELDKYLCNEFYRGRDTKLHLLGSSIGSWRMACYASANPVQALERFKENYIHFGAGYSQHEVDVMTMEQMTNHTLELIRSFVVDEQLEQIINNPVFKLNFVAANSKGLLQRDKKVPLLMGITLAALSNVLGRKNLKYSFSRSLFYSDRSSPFYQLNDLPTETVKLVKGNLLKGLLASGSIPFLTSGIKNIEGARPQGVYRDGGLVDYHFDLELILAKGLVFYPHFYDDTIPGWFDQFIRRRKSSSENYKRVVLMSPSAELIGKLPYNKIPDRRDFAKLKWEERVKYWEKVVDISKYMVDDFHEMLQKETILSRLKTIGN
ncbi:MAG: hypothetical protein N4A74_03255 [Carboxylicivirga sp.]|nr:hypothetical protein [Carboxylicivirga sp.]